MRSTTAKGLGLYQVRRALSFSRTFVSKSQDQRPNGERIERGFTVIISDIGYLKVRLSLFPLLGWWCNRSSIFRHIFPDSLPTRTWGRSLYSMSVVLPYSSSTGLWAFPKAVGCNESSSNLAQKIRGYSSTRPFLLIQIRSLLRRSNFLLKSSPSVTAQAL